MSADRSPRHLTTARQRAAKLEALGVAAVAWGAERNTHTGGDAHAQLLRAALEYYAAALNEAGRR